MKSKDIFWIAMVLVISSILVYVIHYLIFHDLHHIFLFLLGDIAFSFLEVIIVGLIIERILAAREKKNLLHKLNMIAGVFFNEIGTELMALLSKLFKNQTLLCRCTDIKEDWKHEDFTKARSALSGIEINQEIEHKDLCDIGEFLNQCKSVLTNIITDPNVLEHEEGTQLLWRVYNLSYELNIHADKMGNKEESESIRKLISEEALRVYRMLSIEWLNYMEFLQNRFPHFYKTLLITRPLMSE